MIRNNITDDVWSDITASDSMQVAYKYITIGTKSAGYSDCTSAKSGAGSYICKNSG